MRKQTWVSVVDDDEIVRDTVRGWLTRAGGYTLRSEHARAEEAVEALPEEWPDIVILDVRMGRMDGLECLGRLRNLLPRTAIILHTAHGAADVLRHALAGGANGFVQKDGRPANLLQVLAHTTPTGFHLGPGERLFLSPGPADLVIPNLHLSKRELEFLHLLARGFGNKDIANELHLGRQYVDNRLPTLYRKLGMNTAAGAVARALQLGIIRFPVNGRTGRNLPLPNSGRPGNISAIPNEFQDQNPKPKLEEIARPKRGCRTGDGAGRKNFAEGAGRSNDDFE